MIDRTTMTAVVIVGTLVFPLANAAVIYDAGPLEFATEDQSMWDSGTAFRKEESVFLGAEWENKTATIGGIAGSEDTVVFPGTDAVTVGIFEPRIFVPTPTWSNPFDGYHIGCGCTKQVTIIPAINEITADTRTGAELNVHTSGKAGIELGYTIDSGSVDATAAFQATALLPEIEEITPSEFFDLGTSSIFDSGTLETQSPMIEAYVSAVMQLSGSIDATACALTFGCANSGSVALPTIDMNQRILSIDPNSLKVLDGIGPDGAPLAEVPILNQSLTLEGGATIAPPVVGFSLSVAGVNLVSSLPPTPSLAVDLAEATVSVPNIATQGTGSGDNVSSSGRDDLLSLQVDVDGAASLFAGLPPVGLNFDLINGGGFALGASLDLIDVDAGPVLGITQDFEFTPTLMVNLAFSNPIQIAGLSGLQDSWTGLWSELPLLALTETTTFTPTFWLDALLRNDTGLDLGLVGTLDLLKLGATASVAGIDILNFNSISLNNLLGIGNTLFETDTIGFSVFDNMFELGGFNMFTGPAFTLMVAQVPAPGTLGLLLAGFLVLHLRRRSRLCTAHERLCA